MECVSVSSLITPEEETLALRSKKRQKKKDMEWLSLSSLITTCEVVYWKPLAQLMSQTIVVRHSNSPGHSKYNTTNINRLTC